MIASSCTPLIGSLRQNTDARGLGSASKTFGHAMRALGVVKRAR